MLPRCVILENLQAIWKQKRQDKGGRIHSDVLQKCQATLSEKDP